MSERVGIGVSDEVLQLRSGDIARLVRELPTSSLLYLKYIIKVIIHITQVKALLKETSRLQEGMEAFAFNRSNHQATLLRRLTTEPGGKYLASFLVGQFGLECRLVQRNLAIDHPQVTKTSMTIMTGKVLQYSSTSEHKGMRRR